MLCCMFKSRRASLVRRLWKLRYQNEAGSTTESQEELELKSVAHSMLKRLKEKQLEMLIQSIESKGGEECDCVLLPKGETRLGKKVLTPLILCCKMWRWGDVTDTTELKRLPCCKSEKDSVYECCNPYHWSLLSNTDCQSSNLVWMEMEKTKFTDHLDRPPDVAEESMETGMTPTPRRNDMSEDSPPPPPPQQNGYHNNNNNNHHLDDDHDGGGGVVGGNNGINNTPGNNITSTTQSCHRGPHWCTIAYWELRQRVGRLLTVFDSHVNIFQQLPHGDGLCLQILQEASESESVKRTREKIGFGIVLSKEDDGVWVYNRAQYPIFVNSPTLEDPFSRTLYVHKVCPGYSLKIFDYERGHIMEEIRDPKYLDGPYDPNAIRISFAKGWGPHYSRQFMTSCPCWLEILLNTDR